MLGPDGEGDEKFLVCLGRQLHGPFNHGEVGITSDDRPARTLICRRKG